MAFLILHKSLVFLLHLGTFKVISAFQVPSPTLSPISVISCLFVHGLSIYVFTRPVYCFNKDKSPFPFT